MNGNWNFHNYASTVRFFWWNLKSSRHTQMETKQQWARLCQVCILEPES